MEVNDSSASTLHKPRMEAAADNHSRAEAAPAAPELPGIGERESIRAVDDSQIVGAPAVVAAESAVVGDGGDGGGSKVDVEMKTQAMGKEGGGGGGGGKRKRGRPSRVQARSPASKMEEEEEDVCFICFDGGSLVLCDRRSCPKAYHPSCIKRDEAFFRTKGKWNCGWHICSRCQKAAHYTCYTCTFSLCKGCTKDAEYVCVRGNKGFCTTCLKTIMLIEDSGEGNNKMAQVDFDDQTSWEYLFKMYWVCLKEKLSLTLKELTHARNPWKEPRTTISKAPPMDLNYAVNDGKVSEKSGDVKETPSVEPTLVSLSPSEPPEVVGDQATHPTSNAVQLTESSPSDPASNGSSQPATFTEPIEFSTLAEESVSDLLAEVDAMESLCDLASPTSVMKCGQEPIQDSKNDCFMSDAGKSDVLSWIFGDLDG